MTDNLDLTKAASIDPITMGPFGRDFFPGHQVRMAICPGEPRMVVADVCRVLGIINARGATKSIPAHYLSTVTITTKKGPQGLKVATEDGIRMLVARSRTKQGAPYRNAVITASIDPITRACPYGVLQRVYLPSLEVHSYNSYPIRMGSNADGIWMVHSDVTAMLGLTGHHRAADRLKPDETGIAVVSESYNDDMLVVVTEAGINQLIIESTRPEAEAIKRWLTHEVMPSIRRTGSYTKTSTTPEATIEDTPSALYPPHIVLRGDGLTTRWFGNQGIRTFQAHQTIWVVEEDIKRLIGYEPAQPELKLDAHLRALFRYSDCGDDTSLAVLLISALGASQLYGADDSELTRTIIVWLRDGANRDRKPPMEASNHLVALRQASLTGPQAPHSVKRDSDYTESRAESLTEIDFYRDDNAILKKTMAAPEHHVLNIVGTLRNVQKTTLVYDDYIKITRTAIGAIQDVSKNTVTTFSRAEDPNQDWISVLEYLEPWLKTFDAFDILIEPIQSLILLWAAASQTGGLSHALTIRHHDWRFTRYMIARWFDQRGATLLTEIELRVWQAVRRLPARHHENCAPE